MDSLHFGRITKRLGVHVTRRSALALATGSSFLLGLAPAKVTLGKHKHKNKNKNTKQKCNNPCGDCQQCVKGKCKMQPLGATCTGNGRCRDGVCVPRPTCQPANSYDCFGPADCCSAICVAITGYPGACVTGASGRPCYTTDDCDAGLTCVAYVCGG